MSERNGKSENNQGSKALSGAVGGPGTGRLSYQVDLAVWRATQLMFDAKLRPLLNYSITIEPRVISEAAITAWDIGLQPDTENIEVKYNVTRQDTEEWIKRVVIAATGCDESHFTLTYNKGSNGLLRSLEQMRRIALECRRENEEKFKSLVSAESINEAEEAYSLLGQNACSILQRLRIEQFPESALHSNISLITRLLAGIERGKQLYALLFEKFSHAVSGRLTFSIRELLEEAESNHIKIYVPPASALSDYHPLVVNTLLLLQSCVTALPVDIVVQAVNSDREKLGSLLEPLLHDGKIIGDDDKWFVVGLPRLSCSGGEDILARALDALLRYVKSHKMDEFAFSQVHNAVALARECSVTRPRSVIPVFHALDKLLKRTGDIHLVLDVAHLTIAAAKRVEPRGTEEAAAVAVSLVCGVSWAHQRLPGHLQEARTAYLKSKDIAESIDDKVTLAFISKCLGRLCRIEAEQDDLSREAKESKLRESVQLLQNAIERFEELGGQFQEIADCNSLLARTYLTMREFAKVEESMRKAYSLMDDVQSKDYADLLILNGDFEVTRRNYASAHRAYEQVLELNLEGGAESSEIRARAFRQRGFCFLASGKPAEAKSNLLRAAEIWDKLEQYDDAAAVRWEAILLDHKFPSEALQLLNRESPSVRVEFAELYLNQIADRAKRKAHISSREQSNRGYVERLIKQARQQNAIKKLIQ